METGRPDNDWLAKLKLDLNATLENDAKKRQAESEKRNTERLKREEQHKKNMLQMENQAQELRDKHQKIASEGYETLARQKQEHETQRQKNLHKINAESKEAHNLAKIFNKATQKNPSAVDAKTQNANVMAKLSEMNSALPAQLHQCEAEFQSDLQQLEEGLEVSSDKPNILKNPVRKENPLSAILRKNDAENAAIKEKYDKECAEREAHYQARQAEIAAQDAAAKAEAAAKFAATQATIEAQRQQDAIEHQRNLEQLERDRQTRDSVIVTQLAEKKLQMILLNN